MAGRAKIDIFMLHPAGRVSDVQRRQMTTVLAPNVYNIAIEGSFDDAQALVKRMFNDADFAARYDLSAVNSINWARLVAQVVYYVYVGVRLGAPERKIAFAVPTGNFGDVFAGYVCRTMGLPIERLIVATNVNDILHRALSSGRLQPGHGRRRPRRRAWTFRSRPTSSACCSISADETALALAEQMRGFEASKAMRLTNAQREGAARLFGSARIDADGHEPRDALGL